MYIFSVIEHYTDKTAAHHEQVVAALEQLAADHDADVREAASRGQRVEAAAPPPPTTTDTTTTGAEKEGQEEEEGEEGSNSSSSDPPSWAQIAAK
jgi:hypothetical protein